MHIPRAVVLAALAVASAVHAQGASPTDPQIAAIVVTANQVDIDAGKFAKSKSSSKEVQDFADLMVGKAATTTSRSSRPSQARSSTRPT